MRSAERIGGSRVPTAGVHPGVVGGLLYVCGGSLGQEPSLTCNSVGTSGDGKGGGCCGGYEFDKPPTLRWMGSETEACDARPTRGQRRGWPAMLDSSVALRQLRSSVGCSC